MYLGGIRDLANVGLNEILVEHIYLTVIGGTRYKWEVKQKNMCTDSVKL